MEEAACSTSGRPSARTLIAVSAAAALAGAATAYYMHRRQANERQHQQEQSPQEARSSATSASEQIAEVKPPVNVPVEEAGTSGLPYPCGFDWAQSFDEVLLEVRLPPNVRAKDVKVNIKRCALSVHVCGWRVLEGSTAEVTVDDCYWQLEGKDPNRRLLITLVKAHSAATTYSVWPTLLLNNSTISSNSTGGKHCSTPLQEERAKGSVNDLRMQLTDTDSAHQMADQSANTANGSGAS